MKKIIIATSIACICICLLNAAPDCMDNSWHLAQKVDFKEYHLVSQGKEACHHNCYTDPNSKITGDRGYCTGCGHYHVPRPYIILSKKDLPTKPTPKRIEKPKKARKKRPILALYALHLTKSTE